MRASAPGASTPIPTISACASMPLIATATPGRNPNVAAASAVSSPAFSPIATTAPGTLSGRSSSPTPRSSSMGQPRGVHVGLGGADVRLVRSVPIVGVVEEGLGHVHGAEVVGQLGLALDAREVEAVLAGQPLHRFGGADLRLKLVGRELLAVVVDVSNVFGEPREGRIAYSG